MKMNRNLQNILLAGSSGALGFLSFPPFEFSFLIWVSLVPLLFIAKSENPRKTFLYSYIAGLVFFIGLLYWLLNVTVPGTIILVIVLALFYGLFGFIANFAMKHSMDLLILPFVWVVLEYIRGNLFTGFPWGFLGYSQYENISLIQVADFTGAYGASFLIAAFNVAIFAALSRSKRRVAYLMTALLFLIAATTYSIYKFNNFYTSGSPKISVVQGNIPQRFKWDPSFAEEIVSGYTTLTKEAARTSPDLIIWPETSYPYLVEEASKVKEVSSLSSGVKTPILAGIVRAKDNAYYNSAILFDKEGEAGAIYNKIHLVPFGEYVPLEKYFLFFRSYIDKPIGDFTSGDEYVLFPAKSTASFTKEGARVRETRFYKFGVLICFEDIFPYISRNFVKEGANFLVNITNDAWFGRTGAAKQHVQASVFRAVENRVPVIRSANTGVSCFIGPTGEILSTLEKDGKDIFVSGFATDSVDIYVGRKSFYTMYGDAFVYFCGFMIVLLMLTEALSLRKNTPK